MKIATLLFVLTATLLPCAVFAQGTNIKLTPDEACFTEGEPGTLNIAQNDIVPPGTHFILQSPQGLPCFRIDSAQTGILEYIPNPECPCRADRYLLTYTATDAQGKPIGSSTISITIKCPKPDCALVNLEDFAPGGGGSTHPGQDKCINACEKAKATYYLPYDSSKAYTWTVTGGTPLPGGNPAQIMVAWGSTGAGSITLVISAGNTVLKTITFCVNILDGPTAGYTASDKTPCLGAPVTFTNTSVDGDTHFWDFGDGSTSTMEDPVHSFNTPGVHTVCLYVTKTSYNVEGNPLCCCSDTMCMDIVVDSLTGPNIYCHSTLCTGDASKYWTDAANCASYTWTVLDENGNPWPFTGQGTNMINVTWGNGPVGTVSLEVSGCDDVYCDEPSSLTIPIIPATATIGGPTLVCPGDAATYSVPKWVSADYIWKIVPAGAGNIVSGNGTNTVVVQWYSAGMLMVTYSSDFLSGLPGQDPLDCEGTGSLNVSVKPKFSIFGPSPICVKTTTSVVALPAGTNCTWTISPAVPILSGQGTDAITVKWNTAGSYLVTATPLNATAFCNPQASTVVRVVQVPKADSIVGPKEICLGQPYTYVGYTAQTGVAMTWTINDGGTITNATGNSVSVTWNNPSGPYYISLVLTGTAPPSCQSDSIRCEVKAKKPLPLQPIIGNAACLNSQQQYFATLPAQHPDAVYSWTITPSNLGSIIGGQGTPIATVQWNNTPGSVTISVSVSLCGMTETQTKTLNLQPIVPPVITQTGVLCPGGSATLTATGGLPPYSWSTSATTPSITINTGGIYTVQCTDVNGCTAIGTFQATPVPGPVASISTGNSPNLCITPPNPASVTMTALNNPGYTFAWYLSPSGTPIGSSPTYTHNNTNVAGTFVYYVVVTNAAGCSATSLPLVVTQNVCMPDTGCIPIAHTPPSITNHQNLTPNCANVQFTVSNPDPNVTLTGWNFGDLSGSYSGPINNPTHTYTAAGCYHVELYGTVPEAPPGTGNCAVLAVRDNVCVPLVADFSWTSTCLKATFTDGTTFLTGQGPVNPGDWFWDFGDGNTATGSSPMHTYLTAGTYTVTLTVMNAGGCQSTKIKTITVSGAPTPGIGITGSPLCAGTPLQFTGSGAGIIQWLWNFGTVPTSTNAAQNPAQSFAAGTYTVTLTGTTAAGCTASNTATITVNPAPAPGAITASALTICAGTTATLTAPAGAGYSYLWSPGGATTQSVTVGAAGTYSVVVSNSFLCSMTPAPVTITVLPAPPAIVSGNPVICDNGCTTLSAPAGYTYAWLDGAGMPLVPPQTGQTLQVCAVTPPLLPGGYQLSLTDNNGCTAVSPVVTVTAATPPSFTITSAPGACEGVPVTLTLAPVQPNVVYSWTNGSTGSSTVVTQAGTYTAVGIDTLTGCSHSASITIHPLPDLCLVPAGCYEVCKPDTICGPAGLSAYQWNLNGSPIPGATGQCLVVTQSGTYSLTGTSDFGCTATSDSLVLKVVPCDPVCDSISASVDLAVTPTGDEKPCCFNFNIFNQKPNYFTGVTIQVVSGGTLLFGNITPGTGWGIGGFVNGSSVTMTPIGSSTIPVGGSMCARLCIVPTAATQQVLIQYLGADGVTLCDTTFTLECQYCMSIVQENLMCDTASSNVLMNFCVHVANTNTWNANAVVLTPPPGVTVTPAAFSLPSVPPGGTYCSLTATISVAPGTSLDNVCIGFTIHQQDITKGLPPKECCMIKQCFDLPACCTNTATATPVGTTDEKCCWKIALNQPPGTASSVTTNTIPAGSGVTFSAVLPSIAPWSFAVNAPESITWQLSAGGTLPVAINLPTVCFDVAAGSPVPQQLEVAWSNANGVICRDTLAFSCQPDTDCVALSPLSLSCNPPQNIYTIVVTNPYNTTSTVVPTHIALVDVTPPSAITGPGVFPVGALPPGASATVSIPLNGTAGTQVCFRLNMYRNAQPNVFEDCCVTQDTFCVTLRDCGGLPPIIGIFPNPSRGRITLAFGGIGSPVGGHVTVRDMAGRLMHEEDVPPGSVAHDVQMPGLGDGLYLVEFLENKTRVRVEKLSVIR